MRWSQIDHPQMYYETLKHSTSGIDRRPSVVHNTFFINLKPCLYSGINPNQYQDELWITKSYYNAWLDVSNPQSSLKSWISHIYHYYKGMLLEDQIGKQRSPIDFQSYPKYARNIHSFPEAKNPRKASKSQQKHI